MDKPIDVTASADTFILKMNINAGFDDYRSPEEKEILREMGTNGPGNEYELKPIRFALGHNLEAVDVIVRLEITAVVPKVEDENA